MKLTRSFLAYALNLSFIVPALLFVQAAPALGQDSSGALHRGYRTGYSDGYMAGYRDSIDSLGSDITRHREFASADRAYNKDYGSLEDYRDGYRQGFQNGYGTGFEKKTFESSVPTGLVRKGANGPPASPPAMTNTEPIQTAKTMPESEPPPPAAQTLPTNDTGVSTSAAYSTSDQQTAIRNASFRTDDGSITIPKDTEIMIQLQEAISTQSTRQGEKFTAKVVSPMELDGAVVEGHVEKIQLPGRIKGAAQLQLTFDRIVLTDGRWANFDGILTDITAIKGDNIKRVSDEGTAVGQNSVKADVIKIGGTTGAGAGVGALVGGPVGAAVGAGIGAALGIGAAFSDRGKHINLNANQQLKVRSAYDTRIR